MEVKEINCPKCGGVLKVRDDADDVVVCEYCGNSVHVDTREERDKAYQKAKGEYDAKYEYEQKVNKDEQKRLRRNGPLARTFKILAGSVLGSVLFIVLMFAVLEFTIDGKICGRSILGAETVEIVPFEYITVEYDGINGKGTASVKYDEDMPFPKECIRTFIPEDSYLSNGDVVSVEVSLNYTYESPDKTEYHISNDNSSKSFTVSGLTELLQDCSELTEEHFASLNSHSSNIFDNYLSNESVKSFDQYKIYLAANSEDNILYDVYRCVYTDKYSGKDETIYVPIEYINIYAKKDGEISYRDQSQSVYECPDMFCTESGDVYFYGSSSEKGIENAIHNNSLGSPKYSSVEV